MWKFRHRFADDTRNNKPNSSRVHFPRNHKTDLQDIVLNRRNEILARASVELYVKGRGSERWNPVQNGMLFLMKNQNAFYMAIFTADTWLSTWQHDIPANLLYRVEQRVFHTFVIEKDTYGIYFTNIIEAEMFFMGITHMWKHAGVSKYSNNFSSFVNQILVHKKYDKSHEQHPQPPPPPPPPPVIRHSYNATIPKKKSLDTWIESTLPSFENITSVSEQVPRDKFYDCYENCNYIEPEMDRPDSTPCAYCGEPLNYPKNHKDYCITSMMTVNSRNGGAYKKKYYVPKPPPLPKAMAMSMPPPMPKPEPKPESKLLYSPVKQPINQAFLDEIKQAARERHKYRREILRYLP